MLYGSNFVIHGHDRHDKHILVERVEQRLHVYKAFPVHGDMLHGESHPFLDRPACGKHGFMLDGAQKHATALSPCGAAGQPKQRHVVGFGGPRRENNFARIRANQPGQLLRRLVDGLGRLPAEHMIRRMRIAERLRKPGLHGGQNIRVDRRGGLMIQVDGIGDGHGSGRRSLCNWAFYKIRNAFQLGTILRRQEALSKAATAP